MAGWDQAATILLIEVVGISTGVTAVPPAVAVPAVVVLGATESEMANLVAGIAVHPGFEVV